MDRTRKTRINADFHLFFPRKSAKSASHYSFSDTLLVQECQVYHPNLKVVLDIHFGNTAQREELNNSMMEKLSLTDKLEQVDSQTSSLIQLADFAAGAILHRFVGKSSYADLFEEKVVVGKVLKWRQLAKRK